MTDNTAGFDDLQEMLWSFAGHRVITVASRVGLLGALVGQSRQPGELAGALGLEELPVGKMVRALTALGLVRHDDAGYRIAEGLEAVFSDGPGDLKPFLEHSHDMYERWGENLEAWVRGETWKTQQRSAAQMARFGAAMTSISSRIAVLLVNHLDLAGVGRVLDVGGGHGVYAKALCAADDGISATVLDMPPVAELGAEKLAGDPLADRIRFVGGDYMTSDYGDGFDLVLLANVLHQEMGDGASLLVRKAAGALAPGGRVAVVDFSIDADRQVSRMGALFAINMRSFGDTHTQPQIFGWFSDAGLGEHTRIDLNPSRWVLTGRKV